MPSWKKVIVSGSDAVLSSVTASFLGNLTGTASFAVTAATASTADNFYVRGNVGIGTTSPFSRLTTYGALSTSTSQLSIVNSEGGHAIIRAGVSGLTNNGISFVTADIAGTNQNVRMVISAGGSVGINTTSPSERLHVSGNIYLGDGNQSIRYRTATNWDYYLAANNDDFRIYDSDTTYFLQAVYNGGSTNKYLSLLNTLTVRNNGNVGIGTTNPTLAKLQILGNVSASAYTGSLFGTASFAVTASYANRSKLADSASYALVTYEDQPSQGAQYWPTFAATYGTAYTDLLSDSRLSYFTDNGTLYSPSFSGSFTGSVSSASFAPNFANTNLTLNDSRTHNLDGNNLTFTATSDESIVFSHSGGGTFEINGSPTIYTTGQLLHSVSSATGNVGIGTQTTTARLHVSGTLGTLLRVQNGSTSVLMVSSSGNVGIGTTNPNEKLVVQGNGARIKIQTAGDPSVYYTFLESNYNAGNTFNIVDGGSYKFGSKALVTYNDTYVNSYYNVYIATGTADNSNVSNIRLFVAQGGNVGIGTTNPTGKLHVTGVGGDGTPILRLSGSASDTFNWLSSGLHPNLAGDETSVHLFGKFESTNNSAWVGYRHVSDGSSSNMLSLGLYGANYLLNIAATGNVGIGTTSPSTKLHLYEAGASDVIFRITPANGSYDSLIQLTGQTAITNEGFEVWYSNSVGDVHLSTTYNDAAAAIRFHTATGASKSTSNERMTIAGGGNVGIGSASPAQKLDVNGAIRATLSSVNQANLVMYNSSTGLLTYLATSSFSVVSSSYAVSSSFSTFAATANYATTAGSAGTATNADNAYVATTTDNQNFSLVLALPGHDEYEELKADSANSSYNPSTGTLTAVRLVETSALKYKENIESLGSTLDQVLKLRGVSFTKKNTGEQQIGFIADEIEKEFPQIVTKDDQGEVHGLSYQRMTAVLLESVKDLNTKIDAQNLFIKDLLDRIEKLENK